MKSTVFLSGKNVEVKEPCNGRASKPVTLTYQTDNVVMGFEAMLSKIHDRSASSEYYDDLKLQSVHGR